METKAMSKKTLINLLATYKDETIFFEEDIKKLFQQNGDDYHLANGRWHKTSKAQS